MQVIKRSGEREEVSFDKVLERIRRAAEGLNVNPTAIAQKVLGQIYDGVRTTQLDELTSQLSTSLCTVHPDYGTLAARIIISNHQKNTEVSFVSVMRQLANQTAPKTGEVVSYIDPALVAFAEANAEAIETKIDHSRDYLLDYFGFKTLEKSYLLKTSSGVILERPQHLWMRVSLALWANTPGGLQKAFDTYDLMSQKYFTHATPTLFNAGTPRQQLSSCFLLAMNDDSIAGIYKTLSDCALISKYAGGIGLHCHNIRAKGAIIRGTNGTSNGLVPMLRVFNNTARYVDQGGGKRNGSFAMYLEPWHADVEDFLKLKLNTGSEEDRARDLFYALWISDLFMKRVEEDGQWTLFCPSEAPGLADVHSAEFEELYTRYEREGRGRKTISAQKLWFQILDTQMETGTPYLLYKDPANAKSNQQNLGTIKSSNLCTEIIEYSDANETAVCNLASIGLPAFVQDKQFNYEKLREVVSVATRNLNRVIDINYYPTPETKRSNMRHRPIGLGVQGLADVFALMELEWDSPAAAEVNQLIFEHMYYAAVEESVRGAMEEGPYETFKGSPASEGRLQPDLWGITPISETNKTLDWESLRAYVKRHGLRNSLLVAPMPTASTSQILGYNECFEPFTSNIYTRRTLAGEYIVINKYLLKTLISRGIWSEELKQKIIAQNGSVQGIQEIPQDIQNLYRTAWELKQRALIDHAAARGPFICQSQSLNLFVADPSVAKLSSMHFYSWKKGLKTGCYYLRTKAAVTAQKFTVDPRLIAELAAKDEKQVVSTVTVTVKESRKELLERLAREYEEEQQKAKEAAERGEGCLLCSS